ncbi:MAG: hypothetical protein ACRCX2_24705 [Paraclostridium sp.]
MTKKKEKVEKLGSEFRKLFEDKIGNEEGYNFLLFIDYGEAYYRETSSNFATELEIIGNEFVYLLERMDIELKSSDNFNHPYCLKKLSDTLEIIKNKLKELE